MYIRHGSYSPSVDPGDDHYHDVEEEEKGEEKEEERAKLIIDHVGDNEQTITMTLRTKMKKLPGGKVKLSQGCS